MKTLETTYHSCPACGGSQTDYTSTPGLQRCHACDARFGDMPARLSRLIVAPVWSDREQNPESERYFDFTDPETGERRHGWFDTRNHRITQVG